MRKFIASILFAGLLAAGLSAPAQIIGPTTVTYNGVKDSSELSITYEVTHSGGLYTYSYDLVTDPGEELTSFVIGNASDPVNTASVVIVSSGGAFSSGIGATGDYIYFEWNVTSDTTSADVSYTSPFAPTFVPFTLTGGDDWTSPANIPAPAPVPESSTLLAGALMILPFGVGVFRAMRKDRPLK